MNTQSEAIRIADLLQLIVQTYPQMSEDEPGGYCRQEDELIDHAAIELRRLHEENSKLRREIAGLSQNALDDYKLIQALMEELCDDED